MVMILNNLNFSALFFISVRERKCGKLKITINISKARTAIIIKITIKNRPEIGEKIYRKKCEKLKLGILILLIGISLSYTFCALGVMSQQVIIGTFGWIFQHWFLDFGFVLTFVQNVCIFGR